MSDASASLQTQIDRTRDAAQLIANIWKVDLSAVQITVRCEETTTLVFGNLHLMCDQRGVR